MGRDDPLEGFGSEAGRALKYALCAAMNLGRRREAEREPIGEF